MLMNYNFLTPEQVKKRIEKYFKKEKVENYESYKYVNDDFTFYFVRHEIIIEYKNGYFHVYPKLAESNLVSILWFINLPLEQKKEINDTIQKDNFMTKIKSQYQLNNKGKCNE